MKMHKNNYILLIVFLLTSTIFVAVYENAYAITDACTDMNGMVIPCPDTGHSKPGPKNRPTRVVPSPSASATSNPTSTQTSTPIPTATLAAIPITGGGAGSNISNSSLPAVQNPGQGASPFSLPGPLGMIIAVLIIVVCFIGGFGAVRFFRKSGGTTSGFADGSVRNTSPGNQFDKYWDSPSNQFQKADNPSNQFQKADNPANQFQKADDSANQSFKTE